METPKFLIKSIRFYFTTFIVLLLSLLTFVDLSLYNEGQEIRETVEKQQTIQAKLEIENAFANSLNILRQEIKNIAEWDEVHQQFHDPSYYFFWHDERLQESGYYKPYYDGLELYSINKKILTPASPDNRIHYRLPERITTLEPMVAIKANQETHVVLFEEVKARGTNELIGYIGISADLLPMLLSQNSFYSVNKATIAFTAKQDFKYTDILDNLTYEPLENPVSEYLWQLIQGFIIELIVLMIIISLFLSIIFNITIFKPLETISNYLKKLKSKPNEIHPLPQETFFLKEFEELKISLHDYHRELQRTQEQLDKQNQTVWEQARRDGLTNVFNRRAFDEAWSEALDSFERFKTPTVFILFDCDFFKALNDTYGHEVGDEVIKLTAATLQKSLPIGIACYRIGGDEFAVIVQDCQPEVASKIANNCLTALENAPFAMLGIKETLTFSVGLSSASVQNDNDIANLPRQADMAMYKAKQSVREKIQCYHQSLDAESLPLLSNNLVNTIVDAINTGNNMAMHYQPIKSLTDHSHYYEVLIRMQQGEEYIFPREIFAVVDRRRLEVELDKQVIQQVQIALGTGAIPRNSGLSINISGKTLLQPFFPELFKTLKAYLKDYKIVLEITENSLIGHLDYATEVLNNLREDGFLIALDDFGSGYSSIRYLANMPVDIVKFDMSMTRALLADDNKTRKIIHTTAKMILTSGYDLVMEGIETEDMLEEVKQAGATHVQGYLLGRPRPTPEPL